jgi:uncharacterized protein (DUF58 family)
VFERSDLYDAELVARLSGGTVQGPPTLYPQRGVHTSHRRGASLEFSEHTEYSPGDDLRNLDWKVFAKTDRYYVRRYEDERLQRALFVLDASASMSYGGAPEGDKVLLGSKYHLAARIAVAAAACLLRQGDAVGLLLAGPSRPYLAPRSGSAQLEAIIEVLARAEPAGQAKFSEACRDAAERLGRAASLYAVSDFLDEEDETLAVFPILRARAVSPRLIQVLHPDEVDLPFDQMLKFTDLEGPGFLVADPDALRAAYAEEIRAYVEGLQGRAFGAGIPYVLARTAEEAGRRLGPVLRSREAR